MDPTAAGAFVTPSVRLVRPLRAGGMGSVWVGYHQTLRTQVAVKFMAAELAADAMSVARFSREAAAAAQVRSPHVVQMFDHGVTEDGTPFMVMELLEGTDLRERLKTRSPLGAAELLPIVDQTAKALGRAHQHGIVHRDIKPDNIFLCEVGGSEVFVKVLDFGIAKSVEKVGQETATGITIGTPHYMSPEQIVGAKTVDHRTDIWALGVVVFEALTGRTPFLGETMGALAVAIHSEPLPLPSAVAPELPPAFDGWFARACARNVADRFQSVKELAFALHEALGVPLEPAAGPASAARSGPLSAPGLDEVGGARSSPSFTGSGARSAELSGSQVVPAPVRGRGPVLVLGLGMVAVLTAGIVIALRVTRADPAPVPAVSSEARAVTPPPSATGPTVVPGSTVAAPPADSASAAAAAVPVPVPGRAAPSGSSRATGKPLPTPGATAAPPHPRTGYDDIQ